MKLRKTLHLLPFLLAAPLSAQDEAAPAKETPKKAAQPAAEIDPAAMKAKSSYNFGFGSGRNLGRSAITADDIDSEQFLKGFTDALNGNPSAFTTDELRQAMLSLQNSMQEREKTLAEQNLQKAEAFLAENKKRDSVVTTDSGLQYEILTEGTGEKHDGAENSKFLVHYKGTLIDGSQFDASPEGQTVPMSLNVVPGFREALISMPVGSKWKLYIKPSLGYGATRRSGKLGPNSVLIFELELTEIQKAPARPKAVSPPIQIPPAPKAGDKAKKEVE